MANVNVSIPEPMLAFIDGFVSSDRFPDRDAVLQAAVTDWKDRIDALNAEIQIGLDNFERGEFTEFKDARHLKTWIEALGNEDG